ncbi:SCO2322 family protein [Streptomyces sp. NPDC049555]|uniref:SCO2322 family protein n=1 Tax=unclassified Streptomyces TaxID=2593676 RepID=UPI00343F80A9
MTGRSTKALAAALLAGVLAVLGAAPAHADGYRYWSFWQAGGTQWTYATQGPATARPADGSVVGFRFAVSKDSSDAAKPRTAPAFGPVCDATPAREGSKRIAVVLDFGTAADAANAVEPPAAHSACAQVKQDASAADALAAVAPPLRYDSNALLCAIAGYPKSGCGEKVGEQATDAPKSTATPAAGQQDDDGGPSAGLIAGIAAVVVLGGAAVWQARRRRNG